MIPESYVSQNPEKPVTPLWRSLLGTGLTAAVSALLLLSGTWISHQTRYGPFVYRPGADHSLTAPLVSSGPIAWLIASLTVAVIAILIQFGVRWWRFSR